MSKDREEGTRPTSSLELRSFLRRPVPFLISVSILALAVLHVQTCFYIVILPRVADAQETSSFGIYAQNLIVTLSHFTLTSIPGHADPDAASAVRNGSSASDDSSGATSLILTILSALITTVILLLLYGTLYYWADKIKDFDQEETNHLVESVGELEIDGNVKVRVQKYMMTARSAEE